MAKIGRPRANIDKKQFESLCSLQCTELEICDFFEVTDKTLARWCKDTYGMCFSEVFKLKRQKGNIAIRRALYENAKTIPSVQIFYAKNFLGMTDKLEQIVNVNNDDEAVKEMHEYFKGTSTKPNKK